ncbi:MAG TPA: response regulator transcription factor [Solirubrobacteraceae bacterium]|nr:response regulator transcription factor [Solirubrobacteraceae bacterium]
MADVLVVDDQEKWRRTLRDLVRSVPELTMVGEAASGEAALDAAARLAPQLVLMDIRMPGMSGFEASRQLIERDPDTVVLLISVDGRDANAVSTSGAAAVIRKQELSAEALAQAWRAHGPR